MSMDINVEKEIVTPDKCQFMLLEVGGNGSCFSVNQFETYESKEAAHNAIKFMKKNKIGTRSWYHLVPVESFFM